MQHVTRPVRDDDVALVGAACRVPGADTADEFWQLLTDGRDALAGAANGVGRFPADRLAPLTSNAPLGGELDHHDTWDAAFFRIPPAHAIRIDPQQRSGLETAWEAIDDAGIDATDLAGQRVGIYASCGVSSYDRLLRENGIRDVDTVMGPPETGLAGMLAHLLDTHGPALGVSAACASSLLGVHLATQALRHGEVDLAIVVSASRWATLDLHDTLAELSLLSPRGRCRFGDADGDGYVRSEGSVALVLRRVGEARRRGDRVYATVLGSATTHNGATVGGVVAPSVDGQIACLRAAYADAHLDPGAVRYVEAHGTGTRAGDPVEIAALDAVIGRDRAEPCFVGSAKSNVGHTEPSAGGIGLIKAAYAIRHGLVPHTLHVSRQNEALSRAEGLQLAELPQTWDGQRFAGVSASGLTGVNVHVVLGAAPAAGDTEPVDSAPDVPVGEIATPLLLPLSARSPRALAELAERWARLAATGDEPRVRQRCRSAATRRTHHEYRAGLVARDRIDLLRQLRRLADRTAGGPTADEAVPHFDAPRVVLVFPGHGSEWPGMARELALLSPVFRNRLAECAAAIDSQTGHSPMQALLDGTELDGLVQVQPALWAFQVALATMWRDHLGVAPDVVVGHSVGEIAAATVAGALSVADAAAVVCRRSAELARQPEGEMWWVGAPAATFAHIAADDAAVSLAVENGPSSVVLAGDPVAVRAEVERQDAHGVLVRQIPVDYASHSAAMDLVRPELVPALAEVSGQPAAVAMYSTVQDRYVQGEELDASYWMANLRQPVRFARAVSALTGERDSVFVEISPHPTLVHAVREVAGSRATAVASIRRDTAVAEELGAALASLYECGVDPAWTAFLPVGSPDGLPTYPWQRTRHWPEARPTDRAPDAATPPSPATTPNPGAGSTPAAAEPPEMPAPESSGPPATDAPDVQDVTSHVETVLALPPGSVRPHVPFTAYGLDSLLAMTLATHLEAACRVTVSGRDVLEAGTVEALATRLSA